MQPDFDYSAPENWRNCKCSHKSDIFSFGLIVAQTYDLCRHKSLIDCRLDTRNYEPELKKVGNWRQIEREEATLFLCTSVHKKSVAKMLPSSKDESSKGADLWGLMETYEDNLGELMDDEQSCI